MAVQYGGTPIGPLGLHLLDTSVMRPTTTLSCSFFVDLKIMHVELRNSRSHGSWYRQGPNTAFWPAILKAEGTSIQLPGNGSQFIYSFMDTSLGNLTTVVMGVGLQLAMIVFFFLLYGTLRVLNLLSATMGDGDQPMTFILVLHGHFAFVVCASVCRFRD